MHESYQRILSALNLEKWMTPRQIARLLYPEEFQTNWRKPYDRIIKNLQSLRQKDLLRFKDYGLGKENVWALKKHPIIAELGYTPPKREIHAFKYEHEKACVDVFVTLVLSGKLLSWQGTRKIYQGIIPDRIAELETLVYIEVEMGSQDKILDKANSYKQFYYENREPFEVWFITKDPDQYASALEKLHQFPPHYKVEMLDTFIPNSVPIRKTIEKNEITEQFQ